MLLKFPLMLVSLVAVLGLLGCEAETTAVVPADTTRPVKTFIVAGDKSDAIRSFPGRVDATQRAELAFRVSGRVQEILVNEGDMVEQGEVLARLDPSDYELILEDRQATYDNTLSNFERGKELVEDGNISRMDFDRMEASFRSASAALSQARKNLDYTVLTSPFRGRIALRKVEKFEEVLAKQVVFSLQNIEKLDVIIDLPESVVRRVRGDLRSERSIARDNKMSRTSAYATFEGRDEQRFVLTPREVATKADEQTQTFRATFSMEAPESFTVLPGMTANVVLDFSNLVTAEKVKWIPVRAVQASASLSPRVWVLDPETMTVSAKALTVGRMSGDMIEVIGGLDGGEEIIAVGAPYLSEGMRVTRMERSEQAQPRADSATPSATFPLQD
tara:strand:- start:18135 stop:19301 length:1167 start_codon:yes stop_codon:yes gene_type:complete